MIQITTRKKIKYAIRWLPKQSRRFWNGSFLPTEYITSGIESDKYKPNRKGWYISIGCYFFAVYRGY